MTDREVMQQALEAWDNPMGMKDLCVAMDALRTALAAAQRPWVGLTPEEILGLFDATNVYGSKWVEFAHSVEARLKERNNA